MIRGLQLGALTAACFCALVGCGRWSYEQISAAAGGDAAASEVLAMASDADGTQPDDGQSYALDASDTPAGLDAAGAIVDAAQPDAAGPHSQFCGATEMLPGTVSLYTFETGTAKGLVEDTTGRHHGTMEGPRLKSTAGPLGCGMALEFPQSMGDSHAVIPDSAAFTLPQGSIDFWLRAPADASANPELWSRLGGPGGLTIWVSEDLTIDVQYVLASGEWIKLEGRTPRTPGTWSHVAVNFGEPSVQLFIDGKLEVQETGKPGIGLGPNVGPIYFGSTGDAFYLGGAALDHVRLSSVRRSW